jgi:hypothetical protein
VLQSSGRAGVVLCCGYFPLLPGDTCSGTFGIDVKLAQMPKPLLNAVTANVQAWFIPKSAMPYFAGPDEVRAALTKTPIKALGQALRDPPQYFMKLLDSHDKKERILASPLYTTLGIHAPGPADGSGQGLNCDLFDAFNLVYNFRLAAHSSRLARLKYVSEWSDLATEADMLPPAFWPSDWRSGVVPDYERALILGALDLDVQAGRIPVVTFSANPADADQFIGMAQAVLANGGRQMGVLNTATGPMDESGQMFGEFSGNAITVSLAEIDKARTTQAFAKMRAAYAGNDATGFDNDDAIVAMLMQGLSVPPDDFKRPWLLGSQRVMFGMAERYSTDADALDSSMTKGRASVQLRLNVPQQEYGGLVLFTLEVMPQRIDERMSDPYLHMTDVDELPNALRDVQRTEPVDFVLNKRIDAKHTSPDGLYGYEPMNDSWNREFTRLGGVFYQDTPGAVFAENRANLWLANIVDPAFTSTHYLAPVPFPHDVFADTDAPAFEFTSRHLVAVIGLTQVGDVLVENNDDYQAVLAAGGGVPEGPKSVDPPAGPVVETQPVGAQNEV